MIGSGFYGTFRIRTFLYNNFHTNTVVADSLSYEGGHIITFLNLTFLTALIKCVEAIMKEQCFNIERTTTAGAESRPKSLGFKTLKLVLVPVLCILLEFCHVTAT